MAGRGFFISLEGIEGSGKTTQAKLLTEHISSLGFDVLLTREPGGTAIGERIRDLLLDNESVRMTSITELFLYLASRAQHVRETIMPALTQGKIVICERYNDATLAYQGFGRGLDLDMITKLLEIATDKLEPDLTVVLDLDVEEGLTRASRRSNKTDRLENEDLSFHKRVRNGYIFIANKFPDRVKVLDASDTILNVHKNVKAIVDQALITWHSSIR